MAGNLEFWWTFRIYEAHAVVVSCSLSRRRGGSRRIWTTSNCEVVTLEHQPSNKKYTNCLSYQQQGQTVKEAMNIRWKGGCLDASWTGNRELVSIHYPDESWETKESFCFDYNSNHLYKSLMRIEIWNSITVNKYGSVDKYLCLDCRCLALNDASLCSTTK